ncbi:MAG TPA: DUF1993 domain-containing protein [Roseiarcus sp.]|nr:DUF1993 domain-containing protein [Roseiarcus sp.]
MALSLYDATAPVYAQMLEALSKILDAAGKFAGSNNIGQPALANARLYANMRTLNQQVKAVVSHAVKGTALLCGRPIPTFEEKEETIDGMKARLAFGVAQLMALTPQAFNGADERMIVREGEPTMSGKDFLFKSSLPDFYFHLTAAYAILRHVGLPLKKQDWFGV